MTQQDDFLKHTICFWKSSFLFFHNLLFYAFNYKVINNLSPLKSSVFLPVSGTYPHYPHCYTHFYPHSNVELYVYKSLNIIRHFSSPQHAVFPQKSPFFKFPIMYI